MAFTPQSVGQLYFLSPASYRSPGQVHVEGDWSNAAFWLCAGALGGGVTVAGLNRNSLQGDRAICTLLSAMGAGTASVRKQLHRSAGSFTAPPGGCQVHSGSGSHFGCDRLGRSRNHPGGTRRAAPSERVGPAGSPLPPAAGSGRLCLSGGGLPGGPGRNSPHRWRSNRATETTALPWPLLWQPVFVPARYASLAQRPSQNPIPGSGRITRAWGAFGRRYS